VAHGAWGLGAVTPIANTVVGARSQRGQLVLNIHKVTPAAGFQLIILCFGQFSRRVRHSFIPSQRSNGIVLPYNIASEKVLISSGFIFVGMDEIWDKKIKRYEIKH